MTQAGDMDPEAFGCEAHRIADWLADYFAAPDRFPVLSRARPGDIRRSLPASAPEQGGPFDAIFADFERILLPGITHWNHPGFFAYFATSGSGPGVLAEFLSAGLNVQAMLHLPSGNGARGSRARLAAPARWAAGGIRRGHLRHRLGVELKLWMVLRHFGAAGMRARLSEHMRLARLFAERVEASSEFELSAPVLFSVVCFHARETDEFNERLLDRLNGSGEVFLFHTRLHGRFTLRLAVGHIRTTEAHVLRAWTLLQGLTAGLRDAV